MPSLTPTEIKTYAVHDHWTDINKKNDVDIISIDGEITRIKVNGEDYGGGGGESDFSTAEVTFSGINGTGFATMPKIINTPFDAIVPLQNEVIDETYTIALYKGKGVIGLDFTGVEGNITTSGAIELLDESTFPIYLVTGDCTITIS